MREQLSIRFSKKFKEHLNEQKKLRSIRRPIAAIMFVSLDGREEELILMFYDKDKLPSAEEFRTFYSDGTEFLVPQEQIHDELDGRALDFRDGKILVAD